MGATDKTSPNIAALTSELADLKAQLAKETARLDWLEEHAFIRPLNQMAGWCLRPAPDLVLRGTTLREAVDRIRER